MANSKSQIANDLIRVFCAVELPDEVRLRAANHMTVLRQAVANSSAKWERPEKLHITLKFLGEIQPSRLADFIKATADTATKVQPFELTVETTGAFPPRGNPRVLWLGLTDSSGRLGQLQKHLEDDCFRAGWARETRLFHPHLTLARFKTSPNDRKLVDIHQKTRFEAIRFPVNEIVVMQSELLPSGSRYTVLERCQLVTH